MTSWRCPSSGSAPSAIVVVASDEWSRRSIPARRRVRQEADDRRTSPRSIRRPAATWRATRPTTRRAWTQALAGEHAACRRLWSAVAWPSARAAARVGELLTERREEYAALITAEMGKPLAEALGEIDKCAFNCAVVAELAPGWLADYVVPSGAARSWLSYEPLGVVFAVMPWNFPFWQVLRFACAALAAGNAAVLKHSPNVTGCALAIEAAVRRRRSAGRAVPDAGRGGRQVPEISRG